MSEWLDIMLGKIARKAEQEESALKEVAERKESTQKSAQTPAG